MNEITWTVAASFCGGLSGVASLSWWLATRFNHVYSRQSEMEARLVERITIMKDAISKEIDSHENLDNERFQNQSLAIMRIEMMLQTAGINPNQLPR